jgi:hypothetical protein
MSSVESVKKFLELSEQKQASVYEVLKEIILEIIKDELPDNLEVACCLWKTRMFAKCNWMIDCVFKHFDVYWNVSPDTVMPWECKPYEKDAPFCGLTWIIENGSKVFEDLFYWFLRYENREIEIPRGFRLQNLYYNTINSRIIGMVKQIDSSLKEEHIGVIVSFEDKDENKTPLKFPAILVYPKKWVPKDIVLKVNEKAQNHLDELEDFNRFYCELKVEEPIQVKEQVPQPVQKASTLTASEPCKWFDEVSSSSFDKESALFVDSVLSKFLKIDYESSKKLTNSISLLFENSLKS